MRLYPRAWRERYGDEFEALLEECLHTPLDVVDILLGAMDAHLGLSDTTNWRMMNMNNKLRTAILMVFAAYIAFIVAGMSVYGFADDSPFIPMMQTDKLLALAWSTLQISALVALLAIVIGGMPLAWTIIRRALSSNRKDLQLLLVPPLAFLALVLYIAVASVNVNQTGPEPTAAGRAWMWGLIAVFILGAIASTAAVWKVVSRNDVEQGTLPGAQRGIRLYEFAVTPAVIATFAMLAMFAATIVWFWQAFSARPEMLNQNMGPMMTNTRSALAFTLTLMATAVATAFTGLARVRSARNAR